MVMTRTEANVIAAKKNATWAASRANSRAMLGAVLRDTRLAPESVDADEVAWLVLGSCDVVTMASRAKQFSRDLLNGTYDRYLSDRINEAIGIVVARQAMAARLAVAGD